MHSYQDPNSALIDFTFNELNKIRNLNIRMKNKNKKDDFVIESLLAEK